MMLPPGLSMLPVMAIMARQQKPIWMPLGFWSTARPHCSAAGLAVAYRRAASMIFSSGTSQMRAASAVLMVCTRSANCSNPKHHFSTKSWSYRSSEMMTLQNAMPSAASVPGRTCSQMSARAASHVRRGSTTMNFVPMAYMSTMAWPQNPSGFDFKGSLPHIMMTSGRCQRGSS